MFWVFLEDVTLRWPWPKFSRSFWKLPQIDFWWFLDVFKAFLKIWPWDDLDLISQCHSLKLPQIDFYWFLGVFCAFLKIWPWDDLWPWPWLFKVPRSCEKFRCHTSTIRYLYTNIHATKDPKRPFLCDLDLISQGHRLNPKIQHWLLIVSGCVSSIFENFTLRWPLTLTLTFQGHKVICKVSDLYNDPQMI